MSPPLTLVFCGTPRFAVPSMEALVDAGFAMALAVTQPDRPRGRGMGLAISPVKERALTLKLSVIQPEKIKHNDEFRAALTAIRPDAIIVVGYGRIIPQWMIELPPLGNINVHASLLPKYRGAAPIQWAIARGETVTGVTTMRIDAGLDTGDMLLQEQLNIEASDTSETLAPRLATVGAKLLVETLQRLSAGTLQSQAQNHAEATLAPILKKEDGRINFQSSAAQICNRLRGFQPWPGAFTTFRGRNLNVWQAAPAERTLSAGELLVGEMFVEGSRLFAGCESGPALELIEVQPEGKKRMAARDFIHGYQPRPSEKLGE